MPITAPDIWTEQADKRAGAMPDVRVIITHNSVPYDETDRLLATTSVDKLLEKWNSRGVSLAADLSLTMANHDQRYNAANSSSPFYPDSLIGATVQVYLYFRTSDAGLYLSTMMHHSTSLHMANSATPDVLQFTGRIIGIDGTERGDTVLTARDSLQDLLDGAYNSITAIQRTGNPADIIKDIVELDASLSVDTAAWTVTREKVAMMQCKLDCNAGNTFLDRIQQVTKACGLYCFTNEANQIVIYALFPDLTDFTAFSYGQDAVPHWSGDETDDTDLNVANLSGGVQEYNIKNQVVINYKDYDTGADAQLILDNAASGAKYGWKTQTIDTELYMQATDAQVWPERLLDHYSSPRRTYSGTTSLRKAASARVGDYIRLTDPAHSEDRTLCVVRKQGIDLQQSLCAVELEDLSDIDGVRWAWVGSEVVEADSNRISYLIDHLHNKSFESAKNPGVDDTPEKYTLTAPSAGTFTADVVEDPDARSGLRSLHVVANGNTGGYIRQDITLRGVNTAYQYYTVSVYMRGTVNSGDLRVGLFENGGLEKYHATLTATNDSWVRFTFAIITDPSDSTPFYIKIWCPDGSDVDAYVDDIQLDDGATAYPWQTNWQVFAFIGEDVGEANPGFDLDGNVNGVINGITYLQGFEELPKVLN